MTLLFLHLPDTGPAHAWLRRDDGLADLGPGELAQFAQQRPGSACVVFLPTTDCLFARAQVNARQLRQAEKSLGWLIEDQAGEDADALHVVAGPSEGDMTPLLAISRERLNSHLARLRQAGLQPLGLLPDLFLLPRDDSDWQLLTQGDTLFLRTGAFAGAVLEADAAEILLEAALTERGSEAPPRLSLANGQPEMAARIEHWAAGHDGIVCRLADGLRPANGIAAVADWSRHPANLLQGTFALRSRLALPATLKWAAVFLAAAFALQLLSEWLHYGVYGYQARQVAAQAVQHYHNLYQGEHLPAALPAAWQEVQKRMRGKRNEAGQGGDTLPAITRVAQALQGSGLSAQRLDLQGNVLTLDVDARSLGDLDGFKQRLEDEGFSAAIESANNQGGQIRGRLRVEGGA